MAEQYKNNALFCIDEKCLGTCSKLEDLAIDESNIGNCNINILFRDQHKEKLKQEQNTENNNNPHVSLRKSSNKCREILQEIKDMTYFCLDPKAMVDLDNGLQNLKQRLKASLRSEQGLLLREITKKSPSKEMQKLAKVKYADLPLRRKKRTKPGKNKLLSSNNVNNAFLNGLSFLDDFIPAKLTKRTNQDYQLYLFDSATSQDN